MHITYIYKKDIYEKQLFIGKWKCKNVELFTIKLYICMNAEIEVRPDAGDNILLNYWRSF